MQLAASGLPPPRSLLLCAPPGNPGDVGPGCTGLLGALAAAEFPGQGPHEPAALLL